MSKLLNREESVEAARPLIEKYSPYLRDICDFACNLLQRCGRSTKSVGGTPRSLLTLCYHAIQMADGIEVLCSQSCFDAALPLLRSLMEAQYSVEYILEDYEPRSAAWLVAHYLERIRRCNSLDPSTTEGIEFRKSYNGDSLSPGVDLSFVDIESEREKRKRIVEIISRPGFAGIAEQLGDSKRPRKWYSLNGGPRSMRKLAEHLKHSLEYEVFYRDFSAVAHAEDATRMIGFRNGTAHFHFIRSIPSRAEDIYRMTATRLMLVMLRMASKFRPDENIMSSLREIIMKHDLAMPELFKYPRLP